LVLEEPDDADALGVELADSSGELVDVDDVVLADESALAPLE
jgi:hypothetical protein